MAPETDPIGPPSARSVHQYLLWGLFLALFPLYVFPSGQPQPADAVMLILFLSMTLYGFWSIDGSFFWISAYFLLVVCGTSLVNAILSGLHDIAISPMYYLYNMGICYVVISLRRKDPLLFRTSTRYAILISLLVTSLFVAFAESPYLLRETGPFNNPNQLGYYGLLLVMLVIALDEKIGLVGVLSITIASLLVALSLSKAALLGLALAGGALLIRMSRLWGALLTVLVVIVVFASSGPVVVEVIERFEDRQADESFSGRGYDRMVDAPGYLLVGAGERGFERFESEIDDELHSSLGTLLFSYGVPGTVGFFGMLYLVYRRNGAWVLTLIGGIMVYGLFHQGLRFSLLWCVLGVLAVPVGRARKKRIVLREEEARAYVGLL